MAYTRAPLLMLQQDIMYLCIIGCRCFPLFMLFYLKCIFIVIIWYEAGS